jgi:hypothetical protein
MVNQLDKSVPAGVPPDTSAVRPLLVNGPKARAFLGIGATTLWKWKKAGLIETVRVAGRDMFVFSSLERLATPKPQKAA